MITRKNRGIDRRDSLGYKYGSIIAKLTFSETKFTPEIIDKLVTSTTDKRKGLEMLRKVIERFDITPKDVEQYTADVMITEMVEVRNISLKQKPFEKPIPISNFKRPINWDKKFF